MPLWKVSLPLSCRPPSVTGRCSKVSLEPALLQAEQPQLSQTVFTVEVLQPLTTFVAPSGLISSDGSTEHSTAGGVSGEQRERIPSPPWLWCCPGPSWLSGLWELIAESCWASHQPTPEVLRVSFYSPRACICAGDCPGSHAGNIIKYHEVYLPLIFTALLIWVIQSLFRYKVQMQFLLLNVNVLLIQGGCLYRDNK